MGLGETDALLPTTDWQSSANRCGVSDLTASGCDGSVLISVFIGIDIDISIGGSGSGGGGGGTAIKAGIAFGAWGIGPEVTTTAPPLVGIVKATVTTPADVVANSRAPPLPPPPIQPWWTDPLVATLRRVLRVILEGNVTIRLLRTV